MFRPTAARARRLSTRTGALLLLAMAVQGGMCGECGECPTVIVAGPRLVSGTLAWEYAGATGDVALAAESVASPPLTCRLILGGQEIRKPPEGGAPQPLVYLPYVQCHSEDYARQFQISFVLADPRDWPVGVVAPTEPSDVNFFLSYAPFCASGDTCQSHCGSRGEEGVTLSIEVLRATGGSAPFPAAVTPDFERTVRVVVATEAAIRGTRAGAAGEAAVTCDETFRATLTFEVTLGAEDFVFDPDHRCECG